MRMSYTITWSNEPRFAPPDYKTAILKPATVEKNGQTWLYTPEVAPEDHPWREDINIAAFPDRDQHTYRVIAMQHNVHPMSGDVYWDLEAYCPEKNQYITISYADND